jgi:hypothetical protein
MGIFGMIGKGISKVGKQVGGEVKDSMKAKATNVKKKPFMSLIGAGAKMNQKKKPMSAAFLFLLLLIPSTAHAQHPCDSTPASVATVNAGQPFTLGMCYNDKGTTGAPIVGTVAYKLYRNGTLVTGITATVGTALNANGYRYITWTRSEPVAADNIHYEGSIINTCPAGITGCGESAKVSFPLLSAVVLTVAPAAPTAPRVTQP